jgi:hypothetical protein
VLQKLRCRWEEVPHQEHVRRPPSGSVDLSCDSIHTPVHEVQHTDQMPDGLCPWRLAEVEPMCGRAILQSDSHLWERTEAEGSTAQIEAKMGRPRLHACTDGADNQVHDGWMSYGLRLEQVGALVNVQQVVWEGRTHPPAGTVAYGHARWGMPTRAE